MCVMCEHSSPNTNNIDDLLKAYERQQREVYINRTIPAISRLEGIAYDLADAYEKEYRANPAYGNEERMRYWRYMGPKHWSNKSNYDPYLPAYGEYKRCKNEYKEFIRRHKKPTKRRILIGILGLTIGIYVLMTILSTLSS